MTEVAEMTLHEMNPPAVDMNGEEILIVEQGCKCICKICSIYDRARRLFGMRVDWIEGVDDCGARDGACYRQSLDLTREQIARIEVNASGDPLYFVNL